jgi:uncharacterized protein (DUF2147 family)
VRIVGRDGAPGRRINRLNARDARVVRELEERIMEKKNSQWATLAGVLSVLAAPTLPLSGRDAARAAPSVDASQGFAPEDVLVGEWWTDNNEGRIRFSKDPDGTLRGTTTCCVPKVSSADHPAHDLHNPNPKQRGRSTVGIVLIWKLAYEDGEYTGGYVYNPRDGKTYRFAAKVIDRDTVKIRGYMGIPLFGQSQIWKRVGVER